MLDLRDAQVDAAQVQHVHDVLIAALADDRQHAQIVAVVEHRRHVVGEIEIGAVGIARDHRHGVLVELVASARRWRAAARLLLRARRLGCASPGRAGLAAGPTGAEQQQQRRDAARRHSTGSSARLSSPSKPYRDTSVFVGRADLAPPRAPPVRTSQAITACAACNRALPMNAFYAGRCRHECGSLSADGAASAALTGPCRTRAKAARRRPGG